MIFGVIFLHSASYTTIQRFGVDTVFNKINTFIQKGSIEFIKLIKSDCNGC